MKSEEMVGCIAVAEACVKPLKSPNKKIFFRNISLYRMTAATLYGEVLWEVCILLEFQVKASQHWQSHVEKL